MNTIPVLYTAKKSIYHQLLDADPYDQKRDALKWPGGTPFIAHPPCRLWCKLRRFSTADPAERYLALITVCQIRRYGGILEHPAHSLLWESAQLPPPGGFPDEYGGITIALNQCKAGHAAVKPTWLYIVGADRIPPLPTPNNKPTHTLSWGPKKNGRTRQRPLLATNKRSATPEPFARWLIALAHHITENKRN